MQLIAILFMGAWPTLWTSGGFLFDDYQMRIRPALGLPGAGLQRPGHEPAGSGGNSPPVLRPSRKSALNFLVEKTFKEEPLMAECSHGVSGSERMIVLEQQHVSRAPCRL